MKSLKYVFVAAAAAAGLGTYMVHQSNKDVDRNINQHFLQRYPEMSIEKGMVKFEGSKMTLKVDFSNSSQQDHFTLDISGNDPVCHTAFDKGRPAAGPLYSRCQPFENYADIERRYMAVVACHAAEKGVKIGVQGAAEFIGHCKNYFYLTPAAAP